MLILNESNKATLNKKLDALDSFSNAFNGYHLYFDSLTELFTARELASIEFLDRFPSTIKSICPNNELYEVLVKISNKGVKPGNNETYKDYIDPILSRLGKDFNNLTYGYFLRTRADSVANAILRILKQNSATAEDAVEYIFNNDVSKRAEQENCGINKLDYLSEIISSLKITDADNFINTLQKFDPDCKILPLLITNESLTKEKKVSILKLGYKQKDFPKYKEYFKENLNNFEDLDTFFEATIFQNNRVKEKEDNLVRMFKDFFIDGQSCGCRILSQKPALPWADKFIEKYRPYILSLDFIRKLYNTAVNLSTNGWRRSDQYRLLLTFMLKDLSIEEKLKQISSSMYYKTLAENLPDIFKEAVDNGNNTQIDLVLRCAITISGERPMFASLFNIFSELVSYGSRSESAYRSFLNNYATSDALKPILNNLTLFRFEPDPSSKTITTHISSELIRSDSWSCKALVDSLNDEAFIEVPLILSEDIPYLGLSFEKLKSTISKGSYQGMTTSMRSLVESAAEFYNKLMNRFERSGDSVKEYIAKRFFKCFESEENTSNLTSSLISISTTKEMQKCVSGWYSSSKDEDTLEKIYKSIIAPILNKIGSIYKEMERICPDDFTEEGLNQLLENFSQLKETISLIGAVNI